MIKKIISFEKKQYYLLFAFSLLALALLGSQLFLSKKEEVKKILPLEQYADQVLATCSSVEYRPACYDKEIPQLMDFISMEQAFDVTRIVQTKDISYQYCHVLGHELSARETRKDPSKWKEIVTRAPSGICSNGSIHGAFQERFRKEALTEVEVEKLKPELEDVCEERENWNPTGLEQGTCYHALGHLSMYITSADIQASNKLCNELAKGYYQVCFDGVYMQIYQPLEPEDFALIEGKVPKKEEVKNFCSKYPSPQRYSCWSESWPLFPEVKSPDGLVEFCSYQKLVEQVDRCYLSLFYVLTAQFNFDQGKIESFCIGLPDARKGQCFANAASRMIETDKNNISKSVELCSRADRLRIGEMCYQELLVYSTYNFHAGSKEFFTLCNSLPSQWKEKCLGKS